MKGCFSTSTRLPGPGTTADWRRVSIRVAVVDDQALVRSGFAVMLGLQDDIEVVAEAPDEKVGAGAPAHEVVAVPTAQLVVASAAVEVVQVEAIAPASIEVVEIQAPTVTLERIEVECRLADLDTEAGGMTCRLEHLGALVDDRDGRLGIDGHRRA